MRKWVLPIVVLLLGWGPATPVGALPQRRINALAASLLQTQHALLEAPGSRRAAETLPLYFERLLALQPGEKPAARRRRVTGYLTLLDQAVERTATLRTPPALQTTSAPNRLLWQQISLNLNDLAAWLVKAHAGWTREATTPGVPTETTKAITQAIWHIQNAYAALRDALP